MSNNTNVSLSIVLPDAVSGQSGDSRPHVTLLYIGSVPTERLNELTDICQNKISEVGGSVTLQTEQVEYINDPHNNRTIVWQSITSSYDFSPLRTNLVYDLLIAGFSVMDKSPLAYHPHMFVTYLEGLNSRLDSSYVLPAFRWTINNVQLWYGDTLVDLAINKSAKNKAVHVALKHISEKTKEMRSSAQSPSNLGFQEFVVFWEKASPTQIAEMEKFLKNDNFNGAWSLLQEVSGMPLDPISQPQSESARTLN